jgi:hypothetical protein
VDLTIEFVQVLLCPSELQRVGGVGVEGHAPGA